MTHFFSKLMALSNYEPEDVFGGAVTLTETDEYIIGTKVKRLQYWLPLKHADLLFVSSIPLMIFARVTSQLSIWTTPATN